MLISADLFCCGIVTLIQCLGIWNVGARLPIMMGIGFTAVPRSSPRARIRTSECPAFLVR